MNNFIKIKNTILDIAEIKAVSRPHYGSGQELTLEVYIGKKLHKLSISYSSSVDRDDDFDKLNEVLFNKNEIHAHSDDSYDTWCAECEQEGNCVCGELPKRPPSVFSVKKTKFQQLKSKKLTSYQEIFTAFLGGEKLINSIYGDRESNTYLFMDDGNIKYESGSEFYMDDIGSHQEWEIF